MFQKPEHYHSKLEIDEREITFQQYQESKVANLFTPKANCSNKIKWILNVGYLILDT